MAVYHLQKGFREIRWESNGNMAFLSRPSGTFPGATEFLTM